MLQPKLVEALAEAERVSSCCCGLNVRVVPRCSSSSLNSALSVSLSPSIRFGCVLLLRVCGSGTVQSCASPPVNRIAMRLFSVSIRHRPQCRPNFVAFPGLRSVCRSLRILMRATSSRFRSVRPSRRLRRRRRPHITRLRLPHSWRLVAKAFLGWRTEILRAADAFYARRRGDLSLSKIDPRPP